MSSSADRFSPESAGWTSGSRGPDGGTPSSPRSNPSAEPCSPSDSPASPSTPTSETSPSAGAVSPGDSPVEAVAMNLRGREEGARPEMDSLASIRAASGGSSRSYLLVAMAFDSYNQKAAEVTHTPRTGEGDAIPAVWTSAPSDLPQVANTLKAQKGRGWAMGPGENYVALTSSPSEAPARTSPSPASGEDSKATAPASFGKPCESPEMALFDPEPYSWRTWKGSCRATVDGTSRSSWTRWPSAGIGGASGFSTRSTSPSPSVDGEFSWSQSLTTILEPNASERYSLSPKAAAGILRRASRRGRTLPPALEQALRAVAGEAE